MPYKTVEIAPRTWLLDENGGVSLYLIEGDDKALLLDTGFGDESLPGLVRSLTDKPVMLVHSHTHGDHTQGDAAFGGEAWLHPAEFDDLHSQPGNENIAAHALNDGDVIQLGGRELEVIHIPGHSPGSIALLDKAGRLLFSGDTVMAQPVFLHSPNSSIADFIKSQDKLLAREGDFDAIYPCHDEYPLSAADIRDLRQSAVTALDGKTEPEQMTVMLMTPDGEKEIHFEGFRHGRCGVITRDVTES